MNKIACESQNTEAKTLPTDGCVFGRFGRLSPAADLFDTGVKWWIHISSFATYLHKKSFLLRWNSCKTVQRSKSSTRWFLLTVSKRTPTLNTAFSLTNVHAKWWIRCLLISSTPRLSHTTSIYDRPKRVCGFFWCFLGQLPNLGDLNVQQRLCLYDCV